MRNHQRTASHRRVGHTNAWSAHHRMPAMQRAIVYFILGALWLSGCWWLCLDQFFSKHGEFGITPHPWEPTILLLHGVIAILSMYLLGWISAQHILRWWPRRMRRLSGGVFAAFLVLLGFSGFALFFLADDRWQHGAALAHDILGLAVTVSGVQHGLFARRGDLRRGR
jgi:hypothetical protein